MLPFHLLTHGPWGFSRHDPIRSCWFFLPKKCFPNAAVMSAKARKIEAEIECYEVPTNKEGVLRSLNQFGHHPNSQG
jgi:hypothetical protein